MAGTIWSGKATIFIFSMVCSLAFCAVANAQQNLFWAYIGNTTNDGIALYKLDTNTGTLTPQGIAAAAKSPGFLTIAPDQKHLYAGVSVSATEAGVAGFSIDAKTGKLTQINIEKSGGDEAAYVSVDPQNKNVLAAHWGENGPTVVSVLPIGTNGKVMPPSSVVTQTGSGPLPQQAHSHPHLLNTDPTGNYALSCNYGADKVFLYKFDSAKGMLTANDPPAISMPPGSAPRHLIFHPNSKWLYVCNELTGTVAGFDYDAKSGVPKQTQLISCLKEGFKGKNRTAEIQINPSGQFLYVSNRDDTNYVTIFSIDQASGKLTLVDFQDSMGKTPRNFRIDPTGKYMVLANQDSNNLIVFSIDQKTGKLTQVGKPLEVRAPICVKFLAVEGQ